MGTVDKLTELQYRRNKIEKGGGDAKIKKQHDENKLTARERINALIVELSYLLGVSKDKILEALKEFINQ